MMCTASYTATEFFYSLHVFQSIDRD